VGGLEGHKGEGAKKYPQGNSLARRFRVCENKLKVVLAKKKNVIEGGKKSLGKKQRLGSGSGRGGDWASREGIGGSSSKKRLVFCEKPVWGGEANTPSGEEDAAGPNELEWEKGKEGQFLRGGREGGSHLARGGTLYGGEHRPKRGTYKKTRDNRY